MKALRSTTAVALFAVAVLASEPSWKTGDGIQLLLEPQSWPGVTKELQSLHLQRKPYRLTKRTLAYDHEIQVLTPFARTALYVQERGGGAEGLTYEEVAKNFDAKRLVLRLTTRHRVRDKAEGVLVTLKAGDRTLQPFMDKIESSMPKKIGHYFESYHVVVRDFYFETAQVQGATSLAAVITQADDKIFEIPLDLSKLR